MAAAPSPCKQLEWMAHDLLEWAFQLPLDVFSETLFRAVYVLAEDLMCECEESAK